MATQRISIDPVTRIEGHLKMTVEVDDGKITDAYSSGTLWRGIVPAWRGKPCAQFRNGATGPAITARRQWFACTMAALSYCASAARHGWENTGIPPTSIPAIRSAQITWWKKPSKWYVKLSTPARHSCSGDYAWDIRVLPD